MLSIFCGLTLVILSFTLKKFDPKNPNTLTGYKTAMSKKNKDTWNEAQIYSSSTSIKLGLISIFIGVFFPVFTNEFTNHFYFWIDLAVSMIFTFGVIFITEKHLNQIFDKNGERK